MIDRERSSVLERLEHAAHLADRNPRPREPLDPLVGRPRGEHPVELAHELFAVLDPAGVRPVALVLGQIRPLDRRAEPTVEPVVRARDRDRAVGGGEGLVRHDARVGVAVAPRLLAGDERRARDVDERRERDVVERDLDPLAATGDERGEHARRRGIAGQDVDDRDADLQRRPVCLAGYRHQAALGLDHEVVAGPLVAEARDGAVDELGVLAPEPLVAGAEPVGDSRPEVLDDDVGAPGEASKRLLRLRAREVERDAPLAPVDREEIGGLASHVGRAPRARLVTVARSLDLDHVGAEVGEQHRAVRPREDAREVEHADAVERRHPRIVRRCARRPGRAARALPRGREPAAPSGRA